MKLIGYGKISPHGRVPNAPAPDLTEAMRQTIESRLAVCRPCGSFRRLTARGLSVICRAQIKRCSCPNGEVSLLNGRCAEDSSRWPKPPAARSKGV